MTFSIEAFYGGAWAQTPSPPPGYYDVPPGYDFPADKQTLEQYRRSGNTSAERTHVWNVFAGMTQPTPDNKYAIFETWYAEAEAFANGPTPQAVGPRRVVRQFRLPQQFVGVPGQPALEAAGDALLSEVMFNFANYNHIRAKQLYLQSQLNNLQQSGDKDPEIANDTTIPAFPAAAISLKTIWWPVARDAPTPMPIWDPANDASNPTGRHPYSSWKRAVVIDPTRTNIPPGETTNVDFHGPRPNSHVVGLDQFHYVVVDAQTAANAMNNPRLQQFVADVFGSNRPLQEGDYLVFAGSHMTTKEIDDWVWATFWWHDRPDAGPYAADRTDKVTGVWRNYLMSTSYDLSLPTESDGSPHVAFNPWLEAGFPSGILSNCMNCHHRASSPNPGFLPIFRGNPDPNDRAYAAGVLRTDFLWSIPDNAN
ncbi:MAG TPA: hypothetical protein VKY22_03890 [Bradyrhizobium sp.]|nr:hypothetical protein [Bradyrhizobium sp.]